MTMGLDEVFNVSISVSNLTAVGNNAYGDSDGEFHTSCRCGT
jgi:hypothetical protein